MASGNLQTNAEAHNDEFPDEWAISVASAPELDAVALALASPWIRNGKVRVSTVGAVRAVGHDVVPSGEFPHADLKLREEPSEALWEELRSVFPQILPNPRLTEE
jgi:hypothetical protein